MQRWWCISTTLSAFRNLWLKNFQPEVVDSYLVTRHRFLFSESLGGLLNSLCIFRIHKTSCIRMCCVEKTLSNRGQKLCSRDWSLKSELLKLVQLNCFPFLFFTLNVTLSQSWQYFVKPSRGPEQEAKLQETPPSLFSWLTTKSTVFTKWKAEIWLMFFSRTESTKKPLSGHAIGFTDSCISLA